MEQLTRACIDLDYPTELYESSCDGDYKAARIQFHVVAKVLEGPSTYSWNAEGRNMYYSVVRKSPWVSVAITKHLEMFDYQPKYIDSVVGNIILVDMRLELPRVTGNG